CDSGLRGLPGSPPDFRFSIPGDGVAVGGPHLSPQRRLDGDRGVRELLVLGSPGQHAHPLNCPPPAGPRSTGTGQRSWAQRQYAAARKVPGCARHRSVPSWPTTSAGGSMSRMHAVEAIFAVGWAVFWTYWLVAAFSMKRGRVAWSGQ